MSEKDFSETASSSERRRSDRKKLIVDVKFEGGDATGIANTRDIGIGGLYIRTNAALAVGTPIFITLPVGGAELSFDGTVVYADPGEGVGIRFQNVAPETEESLKREFELE